MASGDFLGGLATPMNSPKRITDEDNKEALVGRQADMIDRLARIETKLDSIVKHEGRISALENWRSWTIGVAVGLTTVTTVISAFVVELMRR